ncbi:MAG: PIN domain-containing protein [Ignavibacteriales bacterium]|nr:PIN domain-containing protein [Ignavibacteriales bacterium]
MNNKNECFVDTSVLLEHIKGKRIDFLSDLISNFECCINHIVYSEFIYHFIAIATDKAPLTIKEYKKINNVLSKNKPIEFLDLFSKLDMNEEIIKYSYNLMLKANLLPNDALIISTCKIHKIEYLASFDSDLITANSNESINIIS